MSRKGQGERVKTQIVHGKDFDGRGVIWVHPDGIRSMWRDGKLVPAAQAIVDKGAGILAVEAFRTGDAGKEAIQPRHEGPRRSPTPAISTATTARWWRNAFTTS